MKSGARKSAQQSCAPGVSLVQGHSCGPARSTGRSNTTRNGKVSGKVRALQTDLEIGPNVFDDSAIRALIDDWLVPMTTDRMVDELPGGPGMAKGRRHETTLRNISEIQLSSDLLRESSMEDQIRKCREHAG